MSEQVLGDPSRPATRAVQHIPGEAGLPWFGVLFELLRDQRGMVQRLQAQYGSVYRVRGLGQWSVYLMGADALKMVLLDREKNFSSAQGWDLSIGRLFRRGLMLLDFDEHRFHRRLMQAAFRRQALEHYLDDMQRVTRESVARWHDDPNFHGYRAIKQLTLDIAAVSFLGIELGDEADALNQAFIDTVAASLAPIRLPIPGTQFQRGLKGRALLSDYFRDQIPARRNSNSGDMFTQLCHATDDDGNAFSNEDIINHMIFLLMAAHDTVTSSLTTSLFGLAKHPQWQRRLRDERQSIDADTLQYADLEALPQAGWLFNEALRLWCPVPLIPRRVQRSFTYAGVQIPANTQITVSPDSAHYDATIWSDPERFDPERFSDERAEHKRHPFAFSPYSGGAHKCIGLHFAQMLAKVILAEVVTHYELAVPVDYRLDMQPVPIPKPRDDLPLTLSARLNLAH